jgi:predicted component of viral defense system (DUF524 family)
MIRIRARDGGEEHVLPGTVRLCAERTWEAVGDPEALDRLARSLPAGAYERWAATLHLTFVNRVGTFPLGALGEIQTYSGKWDAPAFETMLADLTRRAAALPFEGRTGSTLPYDRTLADHPDVLWLAYVYLRRVLSNEAPPEERLLGALATIVADPHRSWEPVAEETMTAWAVDVDAAALDDVVSGGRPLVRTDPARSTFATRMRGWMPETIGSSRPSPSLDTPPNRFVLTFVDQCLAVLARVAALEPSGALHMEAKSLTERLAPVRRASMWREVGKMTTLPLASTVLHGRRGYRDVFRMAQRLRMSCRFPLDRATVVGLLENRDIATLYELWVFFAIVDAVAAAKCAQPNVASKVRASAIAVHVDPTFRVSWADGTTLTYNETFTRGNGGAWSVPLRPDVVLRVPDGDAQRMYLLDAKFKVRWSEDRIDTEKDKAEERRGAFLHGDLYKMHAYRDAIAEALEVWIVYPGTERGWFPANDRGGVGGVPAMPGDTAALDAEIGRLCGAWSNVDGRKAFTATDMVRLSARGGPSAEPARPR